MQSLPLVVGLLLMRCQGIMYLRLYALFKQISLERITLCSQHRIDMIDMIGLGLWQNEGRIGNLASKTLSNRYTSGIGTIQVTQLDAKHGSLQFVHSRIDAFEAMHILPLAAIERQLTNHSSQCFVVGGHRTCIAQGSKILARIETPSASSLCLDAMALCTILQNQQMILSS